MPRRRPPNRIDQIADAATEIFITDGFGPAKVAKIAAAARIGPGTIYLYAESKEALYELALRRALEDPQVWDLRLPHPAPERGVVVEQVWRCLQNISHFPRLWLAIESPGPGPAGLTGEVEGILAELYTWLHRYRKAIKLIERSASEWPEVAQVFFRRFWRGGIRRIADYLARRMGEGALPRREHPLVMAHFVVASLAWMAVHRHWTEDGAQLSEEHVIATVLPLLQAALQGKP